MQSDLENLFQLIGEIPVESIYLLIAIGAAVENIFPPIPSDTFVLLGGILVDQGLLRADLVFISAWLANNVLALFVYLMGRRYGRGIFQTRWGHWLLRPHQLERLSEFYERYGTVTVLVSRFFPVFRVLIPAFAGISRLPFWRTAIPLMIASAVWYGVLLFAGIFASRNLPRMLAVFEAFNTWLLLATIMLLGGVAILWWLSRRERQGPHE
ncbi:MAG: DedA family protein [Gemmatimonadota bacterium]|nr:DedA family protein [Gemmatimonadota bacterium]